MEGGAAFAPGRPSDLPNLSIVKEVEHLPYFLGAALLVNVLSIALARGYQVGGKTLNDWYDSFGYEAITVDLVGLLLLFITGQAIYTQYVTPVYGWNPLYFVVILVLLQIAYDLALYYGVINNVPTGQNAMIDLFKRYVQENGTTALARSLARLGQAFPRPRNTRSRARNAGISARRKRRHLHGCAA